MCLEQRHFSVVHLSEPRGMEQHLHVPEGQPVGPHRRRAVHHRHQQDLLGGRVRESRRHGVQRHDEDSHGGRHRLLSADGGHDAL